ncbi:GntG family PLP-dependent aldolase [Pigmentiphaga soli]|uniref:GntG family PLP-dependent aldolase n=1 Tax=Pigmentiphaga soli TaxID=1007095 RepID=A0ABP8GGS0_9BURK
MMSIAMDGVIDLRSDTVTLPTPAMIEAMRTARLGDDGLDRDPTVRELEELGAAMMGKEDALFVVSGTMGNLVASLSHAVRGAEAVVDEHAHIARSEGGGISRLAGLMCTRLPAPGGEMDLDQVRAALRSGYSRHGTPTAMVVVETSHNHAGGRVPSLAYMAGLRDAAGAAGVPVHIDGARIFNAALALGVQASAVAAAGDSVTFCLSKGLSAPMGSVLAGSKDFIARARAFRRMAGGGLRQAGCVAAAGLVALREMTARLAEDHRRAALLWSLLRDADPAWVGDAPPPTNIVMVDVGAARRPRDASAWVDALARAGVAVRARDARTLRLVTHRHIGDNECRAAAQALVSQLGEPG